MSPDEGRAQCVHTADPCNKVTGTPTGTAGDGMLACPARWSQKGGNRTFTRPLDITVRAHLAGPEANSEVAAQPRPRASVSVGVSPKVSR
jgi:hypothetical protein